MLKIGVQTKHVIDEENLEASYSRLARCGFRAVDFSLNSYLINRDLYLSKKNDFFDRSEKELAEYFKRHKNAAKMAGIDIYQMHMPYPLMIPGGKNEINDYLRKIVAVKSLGVCAELDCKYIVIHGFKLASYVGSEEKEWSLTENFLLELAPIAKELGITMCVENLYSNVGNHLGEGPCCNAKKAAERIDRINSEIGAEVLGFCFDTGHANIVGFDMEDFITTLGNRLKVLHIHDNDGIRDLHQIPFVFTRTRENKPSTDWDGFINGLKRIGYSGVLNFETAPVLDSFPKELHDDVLHLIVECGKYFAGRLE